MEISIDGNVYDVEVIKKNNKNTYVRVKNGKIVLFPLFVIFLFPLIMLIALLSFVVFCKNDIKN